MVTANECYDDVVMYDISAANFEKVFKIVGFPFPVTTMDYWSVIAIYVVDSYMLKDCRNIKFYT